MLDKRSMDPTFDIAVEIAPAKDWKGGCLIASQPKGATLGGFRLCYESATQLLGVELSNGSANHEYAASLGKTPRCRGLDVGSCARSFGCSRTARCKEECETLHDSWPAAA